LYKAVQEVALAMWSSELLEAIGYELIEGADWEKVVDATLLDVVKQRLLGGRPPGKSELARKRYRALARDYWQLVKKYKQLEEPMITLQEFVEDRRDKYHKWWKKLSVSTLLRALEEFPDLESTLE
jgi:hypothetical protein